MLEMLVKQGIHNTPMSQIAKASGVATGTIYHHFKSKDEIIHALYINKRKEFGRVLEDSINPIFSFEEQFKAMWLAIYQYYINNPLVFSFTEQVSRTPIIEKELHEEGWRFYQPAIDFFSIGVKKKILRKLDPVLVVEMMHGNIVTLAHMVIADQKEISKSMIAQAISISWNGVVKR